MMQSRGVQGKDSNGSKNQVLIQWLEENKTSILDIVCIQPENRYQGSITQVKWGGHTHGARVLKISENRMELEEAEDAFHDQLDQNAQSAAKTNTKRNRKPRKHFNPGEAATEKQVAQALGEKPPLNKEQKSKKKGLSVPSKAAATAAKKAQSAQDNLLIEKAKRSLFSRNDAPNVSNPNPKPKLKGQSLKSPAKAPILTDKPRGQKPNAVDSSSGSSESEPSSGSEEDNEENGDGEEQGAEVEKDSTETSVPTTSNNFGCLAKHDNNNTIAFLKDLIGCFEGRPVNASGKSKFIKYLELLPIPAGVKAVRLSRTYDVFIPQDAKTAIKDLRENGTNMLRELLKVLYGRDIFMQAQVTGRGNRAGTFGIPENVLKSIQGFINRNVVNDKHKLTLPALVRKINKKSGDWRRQSVTPDQLNTSSKQESSNSGQQQQKLARKRKQSGSPLKSPRKERKEQSSEVGGDGGGDLGKARTPTKSPSQPSTPAKTSSPCHKKSQTPSKSPRWAVGSMPPPPPPQLQSQNQSYSYGPYSHQNAFNSQNYPHFSGFNPSGWNNVDQNTNYYQQQPDNPNFATLAPAACQPNRYPYQENFQNLGY